MIQTQSELAPSYAKSTPVVGPADRARIAKEDHSPWLFVIAPVSFALTLAMVIYLSQISF